MNIRIMKGQDRRMCWTDRKNGYLALNTSISGTEHEGYFRGERKFLSDFFVSSGSNEETDLYRINARYTDVCPDGFSSVFDHRSGSVSLNVSLLIEEQAFYIGLGYSGEFEYRTIHPGVFLSVSDTGDSSDGSSHEAVFGSLSSSPDGCHGTAGISRKPQWKKEVRTGITVWSDDAGTAFASRNPFDVEALPAGQILLCPDDHSAAEAGLSSRLCWYLAFEDTEALAIDKACALVAEDGILAHRQKISAFLADCSSNSGDSRFDLAVKWAQFSGWMMVSAEEEGGIWAGLPWFRDNWGRDTFVALPGILLASGHFAEAANVLRFFARHQNRNPESPDYGRIPNRYRSKADVIYNAADSTLWFIRALWEYMQYTGDRNLVMELASTVDLAMKVDIERRIDSHGFLLHGDADTWMDARVHGGESWSPRGDRAVDVQALWYTALRIGSRIARLCNEPEKADQRDALASRVRTSFRVFFWCSERHAIADRLPPGARGEWLRDFRVRPNQLLALSAPSILSGTTSAAPSLLELVHAESIIENVNRELVSPYGLFTLSPDDPLFHPHHENPEWYEKDAAYHNGTIWSWLSGPYISAAVAVASEASGHSSGSLPPLLSAILRNEADLIIDHGSIGTLPATIHAAPGKDGKPILSGTWSETWSGAEFVRNVYQDVIGFNPRLADSKIELWPHLPSGIDHWVAEPQFGHGWRLAIEIDRDAGKKTVHCRTTWKIGQSSAETEMYPTLTINGMPIEPDVPVEFTFTQSSVPGISSFPRHCFDHKWCGAIRKKNYLERLIASGRMNSPNGGGANAAALEWYFDSDLFRHAPHQNVQLGMTYTSEETTFRIWAPTASSVSIVMYRGGTSLGDNAGSYMVLPMKVGTASEGTPGVWEIVMGGDLHGYYYRYRVRVHGIVRDTADPAARACGLNGRHSMIVDFSRTNPPDWDTVRAPRVLSPNDVVAYEMHIADITSSPSWNGPDRIRRTYPGAALSGTTYGGVPTGFDHIRKLGVTHVQLLPVFDFSSVDESRIHDPAYRRQCIGGAFNWGYDPENYTAPEGSYSTFPGNGAVRIAELKGLIKDFLSAGIGVIMDVVYNHVPAAQNHPFGITVPGYYFRVDSYSGAGDDTASERDMFRAYMIDSLSHWLREYKLSGFRFDLMGLHDVETMNAIGTALRRIKPDVLLYGEGWDMYRAGKTVAASMLESRKMPGIGFFNDALRCGIKGSVFKEHEGGFIHDGSHREAVKFGLVGSVFHPQVHNREVDGTANPNPWSDRTACSVNYTEIHDNSTLYDKLVLVETGKDEAYYERLHKTAVSLVLLAQGMPILHAGMEFMRTKEIPRDILATHPGLNDLYRTRDGSRTFSHNTYNLSDRINGLDWARCAEKKSVVDYVRRLIAVRKGHALFRLQTDADVAHCLRFIEPELVDLPALQDAVARSLPGCPEPSVSVEPAILAWVVSGSRTADSWKSACVAVNPGSVSAPFTLPPCANGGSWHLITDGEFFLERDTDPHAVRIAPGTEAGIAAKALYLYAEF